MKYYQIKGNKNKRVPIGKIVCLARSYHKHALEMNSMVPDSPLIFLKPASSVIFSGEKIIIPPHSNCLNHEVELGIVIEKDCSKIKSDESTRMIPVLIVTAVAHEQNKEFTRELGADGFIAKPFMVRDLLDEIDRYLSASRDT